MKNIIKRVSLIVLAIAISLSMIAFNIGNKALYIAGLFVTCLSIVTLMIIIEGDDNV